MYRNEKSSKCETGNIKTILPISSQVELGDYISMIPTSTSYRITSTTGYLNSQIINPSELNLWRVIKKNEDGTVDMVSDRTSSVKVYFSGSLGYKRIVGTLNTIAAQYTDGKHVKSTRHMGYSNQAITCTGALSFQGPKDCFGDIEYEEDYKLVEKVYGYAWAADPSGNRSEYWLSSRYYQRGNGYYCARYVKVNSDASWSLLYVVDTDDMGTERESSHAVRPIVTLKSELEKSSGNGTESSPYTLK